MAAASFWLRIKQITRIGTFTGFAVLQACGGGGGGGGSTTVGTTPHLYDSFGRDVLVSGGGGGSGGGGYSSSDSGADGSAGDGAPIANATVVVSGLTGTPVTTTTDANGYYQAKVTGLTAPLLVTVTKPNGSGFRYSFSMAAVQPGKFVTINISGLTSKIASDVAVALRQAVGASALTPSLLNSNPTLVASTVTSTLADQTTQLATVMGAAGVSTSTYNPITTPFVTNHTGYDYLLDNTVVTVPTTGPATTAPLQTFNPIIGAWAVSGAFGAMFTFTADGHYFMSQPAVGANAAFLQVWPGLEYGTYTYNSSTGDLSFACPFVDTNGTAGVANGYTGFDDSGVPIGTCTLTPRTAVITGNSMTVTNLSNNSSNTFTRIADSTKSLVGSWALVDPALAAPVIFTFTSDGHYMQTQPSVSGSAATDKVWPGIEYGTYTWNPATGALAFACPTVDTNGRAGPTANYASFSNGLISAGQTPVGTVGGGQPNGTCTAAAQNFTYAFSALNGNSLTATAASSGQSWTLNRVVY
jgi:hypothetical protein